MKRLTFILFLVFLIHSTVGRAGDAVMGSMKNWVSHSAYGSVTQVIKSPGVIYAVADGALFSVDPVTEEIAYYSKMTGLHGSNIVAMGYDAAAHNLILAYQDGMIDVLSESGDIEAIPDLCQKQMNASKQANSMYVEDGVAYLAMSFGIVAINLAKYEILDTYYIGEGGAETNINEVCIWGDSIYAISDSVLFQAQRGTNLLDYSRWSRRTNVTGHHHQTNLLGFFGQLYILADSVIYEQAEGAWQAVDASHKYIHIGLNDNEMYATSADGFGHMQSRTEMTWQAMDYPIYDAVKRNNGYYLAAGSKGVMYIQDGATQAYLPNGPLVNYPYRMRFAGDDMIMVPGGYFAGAYGRMGSVMLLKGQIWNNFDQGYMISNIGLVTRDYSDAIIDPEDPLHFYVASFGYGLIEFRDNKFFQRYNSHNSPIQPCTDPEEEFTWVDGLAIDRQGNLWMTNANLDKYCVKVKLKNGGWVSMDNVATNDRKRLPEILIWNQNEHIKLIVNSRGPAGLGIFDDKGTIAQQSDDKAIYVTGFTDQDDKYVQFDYIHSVAQTRTGEVWVGTDKGLFIIPDLSVMLTGNRKVRRVKIPRNDGTNLADYLLGTEQINSMAEDGVGRMWIGTAASGLFLVDEKGQETEIVEHFTIDNSPLPSNDILSLAIRPSNGEVFVGTGVGLVSYQSDAAEPKEDFSEVFVYPNPVRPTYVGYITISGLMDDTQVYIVDNGGNLVYRTRSNGGIAVWDGKTFQGTDAVSGVYTIMCNTADGQNHTTLKVLIQ